MRFGSVYTESLSPENQSWWYKRALHYVLNSPSWIEQCKFCAKIVTVFKLMRFRCLLDRWNRIVLKTLHFWQRSQIDPVSPTVSIGVQLREDVTASKTMRLQMKPRSCKSCLNHTFSLNTRLRGNRLPIRAQSRSKLDLRVKKKIGAEAFRKRWHEAMIATTIYL